MPSAEAAPTPCGAVPPEIVWHAPGRHQLAGDHRGVDAVLGYFGRTMELTGGNFGVEVHDVIANDEHAVGLHVAHAERGAAPLGTTRCWCFRSATARPPRSGSTGPTRTPLTSCSPRFRPAHPGPPPGSRLVDDRFRRGGW